ncbi:hypothetical protein CDAR_60141 [Caerostris darwini]|uniref:Uncharacterized protein n=1 Tax=Caerostris darwini TaxID=1538125 RepID=A0AAV4QNJ8_9ARAC|nr:hypothetical protein CDAR_60141 [Caerostris darwini]
MVNRIVIGFLDAISIRVSSCISIFLHPLLQDAEVVYLLPMQKTIDPNDEGGPKPWKDVFTESRVLPPPPFTTPWIQYPPKGQHFLGGRGRRRWGSSFGRVDPLTALDGIQISRGGGRKRTRRGNEKNK